MNTPTYTLVFLRDSTLLLSSIPFSGWQEVQDRFPGYMTSLTFVSLDELREYLQIEYDLSHTVAEQIVPDTIFSTQKTVELRWEGHQS